jgi:hypothetical protein
MLRPVHHRNGVYVKLELLMNLTTLQPITLLIYDYSSALNLIQQWSGQYRESDTININVIALNILACK